MQQHFTALTKAIENLVTIQEALERGPTEDLSFFLQYAESHRQSISNQWLALQKRLGWLRAEGAGNDLRRQETSVPATYQKGISRPRKWHINITDGSAEDHRVIAPHTSESSPPGWADCPVALMEQIQHMAQLYQVFETQRREMDHLQQRLSDLEDVYEEDDSASVVLESIEHEEAFGL